MRIDGQTVYLQYQMTLTPSLANTLVQTTPPPNIRLLVPVTCNPSQTRSIYTLCLRLRLRLRLRLPSRNHHQRHDHRKHSSNVSRYARYPKLLLSLASSVTCWMLFPNLFNSLFPIGFDSPFPTWFDLQFSIRFDLRFPIRFDSVFFNYIRLTFNTLIFYLSRITRFTFQSGFRESHIGQGVFEIVTH